MTFRLVGVEGSPLVSRAEVIDTSLRIADVIDDLGESGQLRGLNAALLAFLGIAQRVGLELDQVEQAIEINWKETGGLGEPLRPRPPAPRELRRDLHVPRHGRVRR